MNTWTRTAAAIAVAATALTTAAPARAGVFDEFYAAIDWLGKKYGVTVYVSAEPMDYGTYAYTNGSDIVLNTGYIQNPDLFYSDFANDLYHGYHRGELCTAPQYVAAHEFAHALDNFDGQGARSELVSALQSGFGGTVSGYALESPGEAVAEAFAAVECGSSPTPAEKSIYTMLVN